MPGAIIELVTHIERSFMTCPGDAYIPDTLHRLAIGAMLLPFAAQVVVTYLGLFTDCLFNWALAIGMWTNTLVLWALQEVLPQLAIPNTCLHPTTTRPAASSATIWLIFIYNLVFVMRNPDKTQRIPDSVRLVLIGFAALITSYCNYYLGLYTVAEVLLGSLAGVTAGAILCVVVYIGIIPHMRDPLSRRVLHAMHLHARKFNHHIYPEGHVSIPFNTPIEH